MALLELENIHTYYGNIHALKGVSLVVEEAEIVSLIGGQNHHLTHHQCPAATARGHDSPGW